MDFLAPMDDGDGFVGYIAAINMGVEELVVGPQSSNLRFQLEWERDELQSVGAVFEGDVVCLLQKSGHQLRILKRVLNKIVPAKKWPYSIQDFRRAQTHLNIENDLIVHQKENTTIPVISFSLLVELMLVLHCNIAHSGRDKIISLLLKQAWHTCIHKIAGDVCRTCASCQLKKVTLLRVLPPTHKISTQRPFELVAANLVELGKTTSGYISCLMAVDHNSKWLCSVPLRDKKAVTVGKAFEKQVLPSLLRVP